MRIRLSLTTNDLEINKLIVSIIEACNDSSYTKPAFLVRKKSRIDDDWLYHCASVKTIMNFLHDGYEIVAVIQKY